MNNNLRSYIKDICQIGIFTAVIVICAQIAIPLPGGVPMTLQVWGILLAGILLGPKNGSLAVLIYVLLGAVGAPVFAGLSGGLGIILGPSGGFILSFPIMALAAGLGANRGGKFLSIGIASAIIVNFANGMLYFAFVTGSNLTVSFSAAVAPFLPAALLQIIVLSAVGVRLRRTIIQALKNIS